MASRAKSREAVALILDVGKSMQEQSIHSNLTVFQEAKSCVIKILEQKIFSESPNEYVLILCGSDGTNNGLKQEGSNRYENIFVYGNLRRPTFELLQYIEDINTTHNEANIADAIVVGADVIHEETAGQKFNGFKIVFVTNFGGRFEVNDFNYVVKNAIQRNNFQLVFMCYLNSETSENAQEFSNEQRKAKQCCEAIQNLDNCIVYSFEEAKEALKYIQPKRIKPAPWYGNLYLGNLFTTPIVGYIVTTQSKLKSWNISKKDETLLNQETGASMNESSENSYNSQSDKVSRKTVHFLGDNKEEVYKEDVIRGYLYGSTIVTVSKEDEEAMKYQSGRKGLEILFFTSKHNIQVHYKSGDRTMIVAVNHKHPNDAIEFNALARALHETDCVAIVRYCRLEKFTSQLGYLAPVIDATKVVFTYIRLPFAEDMRYYNFPAFNKAANDIPTNEQLSVIDDLISSMDLSTAGIDEEGNKCEALVCEQVTDPNKQIMFQQILSKTLKGYEPETVDPFVIRTVFAEKEQILSRIKEKFLLEEVVKEKRSLSPNLDITPAVDNKKVKVEESTDVEIIINESQPSKSFSDFINAGHSWTKVCQKLEEVIVKLSQNVMGFNDAKILDALNAYRKNAIEKQETQSYNTLLRSLKIRLRGRILWKSILQRNLALITKVECEGSDVSIDEAKSFAA